MNVELPAYRSHKVVNAAKIQAIETEPDSMKLALAVRGGTLTLSVPNAYRKHAKDDSLDNLIGGYFVQYEDGYQSWSPATAFESGYTPHEPNGGSPMVHPPQYSDSGVPLITFVPGIPPTARGPLHVLQQVSRDGARQSRDNGNFVEDAASDVIRYHAPIGDQAARHQMMADAAAAFLVALCEHVPPGPERSTAISRLREAKMWASAGIALEASNGVT